jgi:hypothetical protein
MRAMLTVLEFGARVDEEIDGRTLKIGPARG